MNHKAVDTSVENVVKIEVPAAWATAMADQGQAQAYGAWHVPHVQAAAMTFRSHARAYGVPHFTCDTRRTLVATPHRRAYPPAARH